MPKKAVKKTAVKAVKKAAPKKAIKKTAVKKPVAKAVKKAAPKKAVKMAKKAAAKKNIVKKPVKKAVKKADPGKKKPAKKIVKKVIKKAGSAKSTKTAAKKAVIAKKAVKKTAVKAVKKPAPKKAAPAKPVKKVLPIVQRIKPQPAVAAAKETDSLTEAEIQEIKRELIALRDDAQQRLKNTKSMDMPSVDAGDDPVDKAGESLDKEMLFELAGNAHNMLNQIEAALRKIEKGNYGKCDICRRPISKKRMKALPFARYCIVCQQTHEHHSY